MLRTEDHDLWLDPGIADPKRVVDCLRPFDAALMRKLPANARVNRPDGAAA
jgi:hypothetical protein